MIEIIQATKKPVTVQAVRLADDNANAQAIAEWINSQGGKAHMGFRAAGDRLCIVTSEGTMEGTPGDWIIRGVKGEFYPCKPDIFEATYNY